MNRNDAPVINLPVKRKIENHNPTIIAYFKKSKGGAGVGYLNKLMHKNLKPSNTAAVCFIQSPLDKISNRIIKRTIDIILAVMVIAGILSWLIPIMAILIKATSRGPVFFLQKRNKQNGAVFTCIKFRSMVVNTVADILPVEENDKRITSVGRVIRKIFIDELPQFFNVLWGDMSVVGPRPHMLQEHLKFESLVPNYNFRDSVKPGITGLSQVAGLEGPANTIMKMNSRVTTDNIYIRNWSLKLDLMIILRTIYKLSGAR